MPFGRPFRAISLCVSFPGLKPWAVFCSPVGRLELAQENVQTPEASRLTQAGSNHPACRFGHFGSPEGRKQNSPWASALGLDGVSEAHEALPDTKICGDPRPDR